MAQDKHLSELLKWGIENSQAAGNDAPAAAEQPPAARSLNPEAMAALFGGPSEAELMRMSMAAMTSTDPDMTLENKLIAFDNFEQLIESLDNANNLANLSLWTPLLGLLEHDAADMRRMAAWCVGTAVQNNQPSQERLLAVGGIPKLVALGTKEGEDAAVRRKAVYALSSACRNYQPAMDVCSEELGKLGGPSGKVDAMDMDAVDEIMNELKGMTGQGSS